MGYFPSDYRRQTLEHMQGGHKTTNLHGTGPHMEQRRDDADCQDKNKGSRRRYYNNNTTNRSIYLSCLIPLTWPSNYQLNCPSSMIEGLCFPPRAGSRRRRCSSSSNRRCRCLRGAKTWNWHNAQDEDALPPQRQRKARRQCVRQRGRTGAMIEAYPTNSVNY